MKATITTSSAERIEVTRTADTVRLGFHVFGRADRTAHKLWVAEDGREYVKAGGVWWPVKRNAFDQARVDRRWNEAHARTSDPAALEV